MFAAEIKMIGKLVSNAQIVVDIDAVFDLSDVIHTGYLRQSGCGC